MTTYVPENPFGEGPEITDPQLKVEIDKQTVKEKLAMMAGSLGTAGLTFVLGTKTGTEVVLYPVAVGLEAVGAFNAIGLAALAMEHSYNFTTRTLERFWSLNKK